MLHKMVIGIFILFLCLIFAGCSDETVQVNQAIPVNSESPFGKQSLELRNCEGKEELHRTLASQVEIASTITIAEEATSIATGDTMALSTAMKAPLSDQVKRAYQQAYEAAKDSVEQVDLAVPVGRIRTFTVDWKRQAYSSTISFTVNNEACTAAYTYTLDIPEITSFREMSCTA